MSSTQDALRTFLSSNAPVPGNLDILCLGRDVASDAAAIAVLLLGLAREDTRQRLYPRVYLLTVQGSGLEAAIRAHCAEELSEYIEGADAAAIERVLENRLHLRSATTLDFNTVIDVMSGVPDESAIIVVNAASYRPSRPVKQDVATSGHKTPFGETIRTVIEEDEWAPALVEFANFLQTTVEQKRLYVTLLSGEYSPVLEENKRNLQSIKGGVLYSRPAMDVEGHVLQQSMRWRKMITEGMEDAAFGEIDALELSELNRALVKAQCLSAVGRSIEGFDLLRPSLEDLHRNGSPGAQVNVARMALHAGEHAESLALLDAAIAADPTDEPTLRAIHQHA
ncbi:MAG: hypothetical protein IT372_33980, partial [Polyangiaceae bacterium]|nr:hypothetical protein [Polyangiaceae bacterium]